MPVFGLQYPDIGEKKGLISGSSLLPVLFPIIHICLLRLEGYADAEHGVPWCGTAWAALTAATWRTQTQQRVLTLGPGKYEADCKGLVFRIRIRFIRIRIQPKI